MSTCLVLDNNSFLSETNASEGAGANLQNKRIEVGKDFCRWDLQTGRFPVVTVCTALAV